MRYVGRATIRLIDFEFAKAKDFGNTSPNNISIKKDAKATHVADARLTCCSILIIRMLAEAK
jgi:hypothetical protein